MSTESVPADPLWKATEKFVWACAIKGEEADLNKRDGFCPLPRYPDDWIEKRTVSPTFLATILTEKRYKEAIHPCGLRIIGARFLEPIDLNDRSIPFPLWLVGCRFEKDLDAGDLVCEGPVSFEASHFASPLSLQRANLHKSLSLRHAIFREVNLIGARITGTLSFIGATLNGKLNMDKISINSSLFMRKGATFREVVLRSARIGGQLSLQNASVKGKLNMQAMQVGGNCSARNFALEGRLNANGAQFMGNLDFSGASFSPSEGSDLATVGLNGATIAGELRFWQPRASPIKWVRTALILRNVSCGALQDHPEEKKGVVRGWPKDFDLTGFTYERLGGLGGAAKGSIAHRSKEWILNWLSRQADTDTLFAYRDNKPIPAKVNERDRFAPQPYNQLASVLEKEGFPDMAKEVLYAMKERIRRVRKEENRPLIAFWMLLEKIFIGYGYYNFRALYWAFAIWYVGTVVGLMYLASHGPIGEIMTQEVIFHPAAYSLDMLLPIVRFYELNYYIDLNGWFYRWFFYGEQVMGYVLAFFVGAGLSGLTKR